MDDRKMDASKKSRNRMIANAKATVAGINPFFHGNRPARFLNPVGEMPVIRLKYFPNTDWEGKFSLSAICWTVMSVDKSNALHSVTT